MQQLGGVAAQARAVGMAATAGVCCQVELTVWGQLCALSRVPQSPLSAPVPPLPLMSAAGQSSMSPSPAASMIGPVMRPNVMTVFAVVFTMPMVSVLQRGDAAAHRARDVILGGSFSPASG